MENLEHIEHPKEAATRSTAGRLPIATAELEKKANESLGSKLLPVGCFELGLDTDANDHAEIWRRGVPSGDSEHYDHHEAYSLQACFIFMYSAQSDCDRNYYIAQRYLAFLASSQLCRTPCPLEELREPLAELLVRLTVEQARQFDAYLRFKRQPPTAGQARSPKDDYLEAADFMDRTFTPGCASCRRYPDCLADLRRYNIAARTRAFRAYGSPLERCHLVASRVAESGEATRAAAEEFVRTFYDWMDSQDGNGISQTDAAKLLKYSTDQPHLVTVLELTTRCFLRRVVQESRA